MLKVSRQSFLKYFTNIQVKSIIRTCLMKLAQGDKQKQSPAIYLLLIPGKVGVKFLKSWLSYAVEKYRPGTVRSYLVSLCLFYKFLIRKEKSISGLN